MSISKPVIAHLVDAAAAKGARFHSNVKLLPLRVQLAKKRAQPSALAPHGQRASTLLVQYLTVCEPPELAS